MKETNGLSKIDLIDVNNNEQMNNEVNEKEKDNESKYVITKENGLDKIEQSNTNVDVHKKIPEKCEIKSDSESNNILNQQIIKKNNQINEGKKLLKIDVKSEEEVKDTLKHNSSSLRMNKSISSIQNNSSFYNNDSLLINSFLEKTNYKNNTNNLLDSVNTSVHQRNNSHNLNKDNSLFNLPPEMFPLQTQSYAHSNRIYPMNDLTYKQQLLLYQQNKQIKNNDAKSLNNLFYSDLPVVRNNQIIPDVSFSSKNTTQDSSKIHETLDISKSSLYSTLTSVDDSHNAINREFLNRQRKRQKLKDEQYYNASKQDKPQFRYNKYFEYNNNQDKNHSRKIPINNCDNSNNEINKSNIHFSLSNIKSTPSAHFYKTRMSINELRNTASKFDWFNDYINSLQKQSKNFNKEHLKIFPNKMGDDFSINFQPIKHNEKTLVNEHQQNISGYPINCYNANSYCDRKNNSLYQKVNNGFEYGTLTVSHNKSNINRSLQDHPYNLYENDINHNHDYQYKNNQQGI